MKSESSHNNPTWNAFRDTFCELEKAGVRVCLLRDDPLKLHELAEVDVLIPVEMRAKTAEALVNQGWTLRTVNRPGPGKQVYCRYYNRQFIWIDLHYEMVQNGLVYMDAAWVLESSRPFRDGLVLPSVEAWLLHVIHHVVLGKSLLAEKYITRLSGVTRSGFDSDLVLAQAKKYRLDGVIASIIDSPVDILSDVEGVASFNSRARQLLLQTQFSNRIRTTRRWLLKKTVNIRRLKAGYTIAIIGVDGAGKSTFISTLRGALKGAGAETREAYMGPWGRYLLPTTKFLSRLGSNPLDNIPNTDRSVPLPIRVMKWMKGITRRYLYYGNSLFEVWGRYFVLVFPHRIRGRLVLMDRYYYDLEVGYKNKEIRNARRLRRVLMALAPRPHLTICLSADPVAIANRKKEDPLHEVVWAVKAYAAFAERRNISIVRTDADIDDVVDHFLQKHWRRFV